MDEQQRQPSDQLMSELTDQFADDGEPPISEQHLRRLRAELIRDDDLHLSKQAIALLKEVCVDARCRGIRPERLIVVLKEEIRDATRTDEYRRRPLLDETVTRCIRLFFAGDTTS